LKRAWSFWSWGVPVMAVPGSAGTDGLLRAGEEL